MSHPAQLYIKYLLAIGNAGQPGLVHVNETLQRYKVPDIQEDEFNRLAAEFQIPAGLLVHNKKHPATHRFMEDSGLLAVWLPGPNEETMLRLIGQPLILQAIQLLLIGGIPAGVVADKIQARYHPLLPVNQQVIELYEQFFWNWRTTGEDEWEVLLHRDRRRDHLLAALSCGTEQAMYRAGYNPKVDGKKMLRDVHRSIYFRAEATRRMFDTKETAEILTKYSKELASLYQILFSGGQELEDVLQALNKNGSVKTESPNHKALTDVARTGTHSGSARKTKKEKEAPDGKQ